jgi:hypothetical protein
VVGRLGGDAECAGVAGDDVLDEGGEGGVVAELVGEAAVRRVASRMMVMSGIAGGMSGMGVSVATSSVWCRWTRSRKAAMMDSARRASVAPW